MVAFSVPSAAASLAGVVRLYLDHLAARVAAGSYSPKTRANVARLLGDFAAYHGETSVAATRQFHLSAWLGARVLRWGVRTRQDAAAAVLACFRWAQDEELIPRPLFRRVRERPGVAAPRPPVSDADYVAVLRACMGRRGSRALRRILYFLRATGCRPGEARALRWDQVDFGRGLAVLTEHKTAHLTGRPRLVGLTDRLVRFLGNLHRQAGRPLGGYVFLDNRGKPFSGPSAAADTRGKDKLCRMWQRWAVRAGLGKRVTLHGFRRAWTVRGIEAGLADRALADQAGWSTTRMVSHYGQASRAQADHLRQVAAQVAGRRRPVRRPAVQAAPLFEHLE